MLTDISPLKPLLPSPRPKKILAIMAQEGSEASVASSSSAPTPNWWEIHANPIASWHTMNRWQPNTHCADSSCEEDLSISDTSFTNASNDHSGLSIGSEAADLAAEPVENHIWNQVLLSVGSGGDMHNGHNDEENFLGVLSSKSLATENIFDPPACDYLKKLDSGWEFANQPSINSLEKQLNGFNGGLVEPRRLTNLSDLVNNWSIAPPNPQLDHQIAPSTCNMSINPPMPQYSTSNISHIKHEISNSQSHPGGGIAGGQTSNYLPYLQDLRGESQHQEMGTSVPSFLRPLNTSSVGYQIGLNNSFTGINNKYCNGMTEVPWSGTRNLSDLISFSTCLNKTPMDFRASKTPPMKGPDPSESKKQGYHETSSSTRGNGRGNGAQSEGKKKRAQDNSDTLLKRSKQDSSTVSSTKLQAPKVKLGDRITALQQIVSPFGKTDTASVLFEAINYIRSLQEHIQLLSDPYMKSSANKEHNSWGGLERKDKAEQKDLRSRGLCLVPISCTPQVYRENNGPDYWMPTYRGCLYR